VHVGVRDGARSIAIINELRRHLPLFVALSASSPFFEGEDSGLASARSKIFENLPTAGLPPLIEGWTDFEEFMATLIRTNCIESIREVWWDLRPHPDFGTVELRMCDAPPTVDEAVALAALAQTLVAWCDERIDAGELAPPARDWTVRENRWLAARYGLEAELIVESADRQHPVRRPARALVEELLDVLAPTAAVLGADDELAGVRSIVERGSGTWRQRMVVEAGGTLHDVVDLLVDELAGKRRR
jgi:carboxylate-amine ligase